MAVKRHKDGNITISGPGHCSSIGVIRSEEFDEGAYERWLDSCAELVKPCAHTDRETEDYFLSLCDTEPMALDDRRMESFKVNVILNHFKDRLVHQPPDFSPEMTDEELEAWDAECQAQHEEAQAIPPERLGLALRGYRLPRNERNRRWYDQERERLNTLKKRGRIRPGEAVPALQEIEAYFEESTGSCTFCNGGRALALELAAYRGVSAGDIVGRTPRFRGYCHDLSELGRLPKFRKERG